MVSFSGPLVKIQGLSGGALQFTRDQAITVSITFYDTSGNVVNPSAASLTLSYTSLNGECGSTAIYALVQSGNVWSYTWDSSAAQRGPVYGHIASSDNVYAVDFDFRLIASLSNRELAGDNYNNGYCSW